MKENLNDLEIAKIEQFCKDEAMYDAVKKVLFAVLYSDGVVKAEDKKLNQKNAVFGVIANAYSQGREITNEELGQGLRAKFEGVHTILDGFENLRNIKGSVVSPIQDVNEAI